MIGSDKTIGVDGHGWSGRPYGCYWYQEQKRLKEKL